MKRHLVNVLALHRGGSVILESHDHVRLCVLLLQLATGRRIDEILLEDERLNAGYTLLQRFRRLIVRRSVRGLDQWLKDAGSSGLRPFVSLAHGIQSDYAAVVNGLKLPWSTGPVEGTATKVKLIKRTGYGRASTQLLRRRLISAA